MATAWRPFWVVLAGCLVAGGGMALVSAAVPRALEKRGMVLSDLPGEPDGEALAALRRYYEVIPAAWPQPTLDPSVEFRELAALELPKQNPSPAKVALGKALFEDPVLSASGQIACQSCHNRELGWGDGLKTSFGHDRAQGRRNAMPLFNASLRRSLFWDGRSPDLEAQAAEPLVNPVEMANHDLTGVVGRLAASPAYPARFAAVFGTDRIEPEQVLEAIAAFEATLEERTRFDRFVQGDKRALTDQQVYGLHLFRTKAGCMNCHNGPLMTDEKFHNLGLSLLGRPKEDVGRYGVTGVLDDVGRFRTPSLRHVGETRPYMHNGIVPTLRHVIMLYQTGGGHTLPRNAAEARNPLMPFAGRTSPILKPLGLSPAEREALVAFLESL
ncbi:cytochrome-c peroxidase [Kaistia sp. MMO-174]|uniref:cytochrome-c peroxidase n=1 Tax=Kaistia sp. MMO-174 TaxID=3081256 RepID=UPI001AC2ACAD|nr:c-type cytochrome [Hyphomicrobiales bacterium]